MANEQQIRLMARNIYSKHSGLSRWDCERRISGIDLEVCASLCEMSPQDAEAAVVEAEKNLTLAKAEAIKSSLIKAADPVLDADEVRDEKGTEEDSSGDSEGSGGATTTVLVNEGGGEPVGGLDADSADGDGSADGADSETDWLGD